MNTKISVGDPAPASQEQREARPADQGEPAPAKQWSSYVRLLAVPSTFLSRKLTSYLSILKVNNSPLFILIKSFNVPVEMGLVFKYSMKHGASSR